MRPPSGPNRRSAARLTRNALRRFVAIIASKIPVGVSRTGEPPRHPPAQFTTAQSAGIPSNAAAARTHPFPRCERTSSRAAPSGPSARPAHASALRVAAPSPARIRGRAHRPGFLPDGPRAFDGGARGAALRAHATVRAASRASAAAGASRRAHLGGNAHRAGRNPVRPLLGGLDLSRGPLAGDLLLLVAVVAWALYTAEGRALIGTHGPIAVIAWTLIAGTVMYLPIGIASLAVPGAWHRILHASAAAWVGVVYLVLVTSVVAYLLWYWALAHLPAARVAVFTNLQPLATAVLAHFFLREHITPQFVG